jgi:hypothetical protein
MPEPKVSLRAVHRSSGSNLPVTRIVIHCTCPPNVPYAAASAAGKARGTAQYFTQQNAGGSAHYVIDIEAEEHCLEDAAIAWHAPPNQHSIGIEICGQAFYTREQWLSPQVKPALDRAAARTADLCQRFSLPVAWLGVADLKAGRKGVTSHANVSAAFKQSDHTDPGPNFPADVFIGMVAAALGTVPVPPPAPGTVHASGPVTIPSAGPLTPTGPAKPKPTEPDDTDTTPAIDPVASVLRPGGGGYLFGSRGHVYAFGGAPYCGGWQDDTDTGDDSRTDCIALVPTLTGKGYWLVAKDGAVYTYGDAPYPGGYRPDEWGASTIIGAYPNAKLPDTGGLTLIRSIDLNVYDLPA